MKTLDLVVPSPANPDRLDRFLAANIPELGRRAAKGLIDAGQVCVDGRRERTSARRLTPRQTVSVSYRPGRLTPASLTERDVLVRGDGWLAVHKPPGLPTHRPDEGGLGVPERLAATLGGSALDYRPVHRLDRWTSGVLLVATSDAEASRLSSAFEAREVHKEYRAIVAPAPSDDAGEQATDGMHLRWSVVRRSPDGRRAELSVEPREGRTHQVRRQLADAGSPIVGDVEHGPCVPGGAPRMALHCARLRVGAIDVACAPPAGWDALLQPPESTQPRAVAARSTLPSLRISGATARVMRGGHPWVIRDRDTGPMKGLRAGELVQLVDPRGAPVAVAVVDPRSELCARAVGTSDRVDWGDRTRKALKRRTELFADAGTTAFRLVHAEADGLPGLYVDVWGDVAVATLTCEAARAIAPAVYEVLRADGRFSGLHEQEHLTDLRKAGAPRDASRPARAVFGVVPPERQEVLESGLRYGVEPTAGLTTGLYTDQRTNRRLCQGRSAGATVANLFAHTGAFSVACAAAGAERVFAVDLGQRYLRWASENLERNGLDADQHPNVAADAIEWLRRDAPELDGAILDPPSHARRRGRGSRDWNARRDYAALVAATAARLQPGGWMLCCVNSKGVKRGWLAEQVRKGAGMAGRTVLKTEPAPPAPDHPRRKGFPEGVAFHGVMATLE